METTKSKIYLIPTATVMLLFLGILYAWSMFKVQLAAVFPSWTASQLSLNFSIVSIGFCLGGFFGGKISQRWSQRVSARVSAVLFLIGFVGCSFLKGLPDGTALILLYIFYGAFSGLAVGIGYNACISGTSPWFPKRLGLVSGILLMGFGFGSLILGMFVESLSAKMGVFGVFRLYGILIFAVMLIGSFILQKPPVKAGSEAGEGLTPGQMLSTPAFWVYFFWNTISASSGLLVINSSANIAIAFGTAATLGLIVNVFNGAGRPITGAIMDKLGLFRGLLCMNGVLILGAVCLIAGAKLTSAAAVLIGMILVGICYGGGVTISAKVINDLYGPRHYAVNFSLSNFCMIPAAFLGPYLSGVLQDRANGGFDSTFFMVLIFGLAALAAVFILQALVRRMKNSNN